MGPVSKGKQTASPAINYDFQFLKPPTTDQG